MYFGYSQIWQFTFVPIGFLIVMATFIALCLVYAVGASRGGVAAARYTNVVSMTFVIASALDLVIAVMNGQLAGFLSAFGWGPLIEMITLALLCVGSMWFMAVAYVNTKRADEARED